MNLRFIDGVLPEEAGEHLSGLLDRYQDEPVSLFVSGGSALAVLECIDPSLMGPGLSVMMIDERFDESPEINNFFQFSRLDFFQTAIKRGVNIIETKVLPDESFASYGERLKELVGDISQRKVLVILGLGADGHTAGIMPFADEINKFAELFDGPDLVTYYDATGKNPYPFRVTVTNTFLRNQVDAGIVFVSGEDKREALASVLRSGEDLAVVPGRIFHYIPELTIFTDIHGLEDLNI